MEEGRLKESIRETLEKFHPMSAVAIFYYLMGEKVIPNEVDHQANVKKICREMRDRGEVPWGWITRIDNAIGLEERGTTIPFHPIFREVEKEKTFHRSPDIPHEGNMASFFKKRFQKKEG